MTEPSPSILDEVRSSCLKVASSAGDVRVSDSGVVECAKGIDMDRVREWAEMRDVPLKFDSLETHVTFWSTVHLLNFGSGFRHPLHEANGRGAFQTIQFGVMGMCVAMLRRRAL